MLTDKTPKLSIAVLLPTLIPPILLALANGIIESLINAESKILSFKLSISDFNEFDVISMLFSIVVILLFTAIISTSMSSSRSLTSPSILRI